MSSSLPINCINSDLLKIIFQKFNHQSSENKFSKQRAEVVQLRLRKDWNRVYSELVEEGHWNPKKEKEQKLTAYHNTRSKSFKTANNLLPFNGNQNGLNIDYLEENGLYTDKQDIILSKCTLATNNRSIKPCNRNQDTGTLPQTLKTYIHPQKKDKNLKEKEINQKDNNDSLDRIFDNSRSVEYNNEEQIHYDYNPLFNQNNKFLFENKNGEDLLFCLKENREIIKKYKKHIDGLMESQNILNQKISDLSVLFTNKFESFLKTQNQILDCLAKNQTGKNFLNQDNKTIFDLTFIENLTNNALKQTHEMTKRSLLKIKAKDGFNIPRLPQPNEARKVSRCLQVRLCKQKQNN